MKPDQFEIEVTDDGVFKVTTDVVSKANHTSGERLLNELFKGVGVPDVKHRHGKGWHQHLHEKKKEHQHQ